MELLNIINCLTRVQFQRYKPQSYNTTDRMETEKLKQSYKMQLLRAGVNSHKAEQAIKNLTKEELQLIREIWSEWAVTLTENETS